MGVEKYRSAEEMNAAPVIVSEDRGFDRFLRHCARYRMIAPREYPRGVFKYRSVDEAQNSGSATAERNPHR